MDRPLVEFFSARDCSRCSGLMWLEATPITTADSVASTGMTHEAPPSSMGTSPRNSVPAAPESAMAWMTSTRPNRMTTCTASGMSESSGW